MNKTLFTAFLLLLFVSTASATAPVLTSVDGSPNPALKGATITVNSVSSIADANFILDSFYTNSAKFSGGWICNFFNPAAGGDLNTIQTCIGDDFNSLSDGAQGLIYSYVDSTKVGALLSTSNSILNAGQRNECVGTFYLHDFTDWSNDFVIMADTNYYFCHTRTAGKLHTPHNSSDTNSNLYECRDFTDLPDPTIALPPLSDCVSLNPAIRIQVAGTATQKLRCGITDGSTYNLCESDSSFSSNPTCAYSNSFNPFTTTRVFCQTFDDATDENSSQQFYDQNTSLALTDALLVTDISNSAHSLNIDCVVLTPPDNQSATIFKVENIYGGSVVVDFNVLNSDDSGNQYKIFTASATDYSAGIWNFNETLTFGTNGYNSLQKIWDASNERYSYNFSASEVLGNPTYFKLEYITPVLHFHSVTDSALWDNAFYPDTTDFNVTTMDLFQTSFYSNISSVLTDPKLPSITSGLANVNYILQLTAKASATGNGQLRLGSINDLLGGTDSLTGFDLQTTFQTLTIPNLTGGFVKFDSNSTTSKEIISHNYVVIDRGFFSQSLEVLNDQGGQLPVFLENEIVSKYIPEGKNFIVDTQYFDPDGKIDYIDVTAYIGLVADANKVKTWRFDADDASATPIDFRRELEGFVDLTPSAPNRDIKITVRLTDVNANYYEIQSENLKMVQFPYYPQDFKINVFLQNKKVGEHPKGTITIRNTAPETLRGVNFYIYRTAGSPTTSDYNATFYKDVDFSCTGFDCSFNYDIRDWVFSTTGTHFLTVSALLSTESEDTNSAKTARTLSFPVPYRIYETARIFETIERTAHDYRDDEEIQLVLQLRDEDYSNLKNDLRVSLAPEECDAAIAGNCFSLDVNYYPTSFLYDVQTGYNYYFFKELFLDSTGSALDDTNHLRAIATVQDTKNKHSSTINPLLTTKCATNGDDFIANMLASLNQFTIGCTVVTSALVTTSDNNSEESRLLIDAGKSLQAPTQECSFCVNTDQNNLYRDQLKQELLCGSWYTFNESPIDNFTIYLTNENSDLSKKGEDSQYLTTTIPSELIILNDLQLLKKSLAVEFGTTATTVGELLFQGINSLFVGVANPVMDIPEESISKGLTQNMGVDCNFSKALSPTNISGMVFYKIKGIKVTNQKDLEQNNAELMGVATPDLREFMFAEGFRFREESTTIEVFGSSMQKLLSKEVPSPLIINVDYDDATLQAQNIQDQTQYESLPSKLKFEFVSDIVYLNERNVLRRVVPITITSIIAPAEANTLTGILAGFGSLFSNPGKFLIQNWFPIFILGFVGILWLSIVVSKFRSAGS